jgi:hypothetical protein
LWPVSKDENFHQIQSVCKIECLWFCVVHDKCIVNCHIQQCFEQYNIQFLCPFLSKRYGWIIWSFFT